MWKSYDCESTPQLWHTVYNRLLFVILYLKNGQPLSALKLKQILLYATIQ